jgi:hypothetical protein
VALSALPDFFVAGVPKAGSTALHVALANHPELYLSRFKEPKYFLGDGRAPANNKGPGDAKTSAEAIWQRAEYEALFDPAPPGTLSGESSPFYLYDEGAQQRIADQIPDAKLILLLRDPIDRAHSNWTHLWSAGLEPESDFVAACRQQDRRLAAGWAPFWQYLRLGLYGEQLGRLYSHFPREQVLMLRYKQLRDDPPATLNQICAFLGVTEGVIHEIPAANVTTHASDTVRNRLISAGVRFGAGLHHRIPGGWWAPVESALSRRLQSEQRRRTPLTPDQRDALIPYFAKDVALLEQLTGETFPDWLDPHRPGHAKDLAPSGLIGTAYNSIDRPLGESGG